MSYKSYLKRTKAEIIAQQLSIPLPQAKAYKKRPATASKALKRKAYNKYKQAQYKKLRKIASPIEAKAVQKLTPKHIINYGWMRRRGFSHEEALRMAPDPYYLNYRAMRAAGVTIALAELHRNDNAAIVGALIDKHLQIAQTLAQQNGVRLAHILRGMRYSDKTTGDWVAYTKMRKRQNWEPVAWQAKEKQYVKIDRSSKRYRSWIDYKKGKRRYISDAEWEWIWPDNLFIPQKA